MTESNPDPESFDEAVARLATIVGRIEGGDLSLEESLQLFEEGVRLIRSSQSRLDRAEQRIEELLTFSPEGAPVTRPVEGIDDTARETEGE